jgi:hypothetical protein
MNPPAEWQLVNEKILRSPGTVMVMGEGDVGKASFCLLLANAGLGVGLKVGVVDGDLGQSHVGPPAAIGLGLVEKPVTDMSDIPTEALYFIGSHSPGGYFSQMVMGTAKMVARAVNRGLSLIVVDCGGLSMGKFAWCLAKGELEMVRPNHLVLLERSRGFEEILKLSKKWDALTCHRLKLPPEHATQIRRPEETASRESLGEISGGCETIGAVPERGEAEWDFSRRGARSNRMDRGAARRHRGVSRPGPGGPVGLEDIAPGGADSGGREAGGEADCLRVAEDEACPGRIASAGLLLRICFISYH